MDGVDNIVQILKSISPIGYKFSKKNKQFDKTFKSMSLENLIKTLNYHPKLRDEFCPSPEYLNNINKYEVNFNNSNEYIKEYSNLNNLPIVVENKNCLKNGTFNPDYELNYLSNKEEKKKIQEEKEQRKKERLEERLKRLKIWKESDANPDWGKYHPNYDFVKKKIISVHIRPPTVKKIKTKEENNKKDINKNSIQNNNTQNQSLITFSNNIINNNNNKDIKPPENNIKEANNNIIKEEDKNNNNNSLLLNESGSNRSNSPKFRVKEPNQYFSFRTNSRNKVLTKVKVLNLKNRLNYYDKNSSINSDYNTIEINKSTNIDDISLINQDNQKLSRVNSMKNISQKNNNIFLPYINKKKKLKPLKSRTNRTTAKYSIYFKKMKGRNDNFLVEQNINVISYSPNYEFLRPHIPSTIFKYKKDDENYKKYIIGKIIRGYHYSPEKYFVFEYKKKKPKKLNINMERKKIIEMLKENSD